MSERGDFFASGSKASKPPPSRGAFFAGDAIDLPAQERKDERILKGRGKGYMDAEAMRDASPKALMAIPTGVNQGVAYLMGLPMDALVNASNLVSAGAGFAQSKITGESPSEFFNPVDPASIPLTGAFNEEVLNSTPLGDVTHNPNPEDTASRIVQSLASGVPGAVVGGGPRVPNLAAGVAGAGASGVAGELGADPATQATVALLAGAGAARATSRPSPQASPLDPITATPDEVAPQSPAQAALNKQASSQSMGAAGAAVDLQKLSPELRTAVEKAVLQTGGAVNPEVLARQIQADSLPVKVRLSQGQALGDERLISLELNARGKHEIYSKGFAEQNKALVENLRALRDETGPEVFSTNAVEHADTLIGRYKAIDDAARADITAKYKALEDANGGQFPVNGKAFVDAADAALSKKMKTRYLPAEVRGDLDDFRDNAGMMTFEQFENLRTNLASAGRSAERQGNGNAAAAINIVRRELESLPIEGAAANLKPLADAARQAAKARFDALDADPAYKAAVNDSVAPDAFVQKYVVNGARDNVERLSAAMADDPAALQTLRVATLDHLRKSAGIDNGYNGNFTQAGYNKALQSLEPKLLSLLDPQTAETARTLGDVARYTQFQPKGSFANNSNTFVAAAAEKAADALEGIIDFKAGGLPIASTIRKQLNENKVRKQAEETFAPGAGLTKLSDLTKVEKKK